MKLYSDELGNKMRFLIYCEKSYELPFGEVIPVEPPELFRLMCTLGITIRDRENDV